MKHKQGLMPFLSLGLVFILFRTSASKNETIDADYIYYSSRLASSVCAVYNGFKSTKVTTNISLETIPYGYKLLNEDCVKWVRDCRKRNCTDWHVEKYNCPLNKGSTSGGGRAVADKAGRGLGRNSGSGDFNAPWDINLKFITDWGKYKASSNRFPEDQINRNKIEGIIEKHRCSATLYTSSYLITAGWCAHRGLDFARTRNRFVAWIARGKYLYKQSCVYESDVNPKQTCEIVMHPKFKPFDDPDESPNPAAQDRINDIAIIKLHDPLQFRQWKQSVHAIPLAPKGTEFEGHAIFAGWGGDNNAGFPSELHKVRFQLVPYSLECKAQIEMYEYMDDARLRPGENYSDIFMCAKPVNGGLCGGDLGGGLVCNKDGTQYLCGVKNAWGTGEGCRSNGIGGVMIFLKISHFVDWIEQVAGKQSPQDLSP